MSANFGGSAVHACPSCGTPLTVGPAGLAVAGAVGQVDPGGAPQPVAVAFGSLDQLMEKLGMGGGPANILADEPGDIQLLLPAMSILISLSSVGSDPAVRQFVDSWPLRDAIPPVLAAIRSGAQRVQLLAMAQRGYNEFADHSRMYSWDEWWLFRLGFDLLAMLTETMGIDPMTAGRNMADARDALQTHHHYFKKAMKEATAAPAQFAQLRAAVPMF